MAAPSRPEVLVTGYPSIDFVARIRREVPAGWTGIIERPWDGPTYGGCGPNVAVGLARLGVGTGVAMVLGDDGEGRQYRDYLGEQGLDIRYVTVAAGRRTSRTFLFVPPTGATSLFFDAGAMDARARPPALDLDGVRMAVLTVGPPVYNVEFAQQVAASHIRMAWQLKGDLTAYPPDLLPMFLARSRFTFTNAQEASYLCGVLGSSTPRELASRGPQAIFVTRGGEGCDVVTAAESVHVNAVPVTVVDSTGAGDAFTAGVLAAVLRGWDFVAAARMGAVVASFVVEVWGCQAGLPNWASATDRYRSVFGPPPAESGGQ